MSEFVPLALVGVLKVSEFVPLALVEGVLKVSEFVPLALVAWLALLQLWR